jgi:hypothetical protein
VVRKNAFFGAWSDTDHAGGLFDDGTTGIVIEDNVFWHNGWKVGASRNDTHVAGGPTMFRHSVYTQTNTSAIARRNVFADPAATGTSMRGDTRIVDNVFIDNPIAIAAGLGDNYNVVRPGGVPLEIANNLILGDEDINPANPRGHAIHTGNGKQGSFVRNNIILLSRAADRAVTFQNSAMYDTPSYMSYERNLIYRFSPTYQGTGGAYPAKVFSSYLENIWDADTMGTNINISQYAAPSPVTARDLWGTLQCASKDECMVRLVESPEKPWAATIRNYFFNAYGRPVG